MLSVVKSPFETGKYKIFSLCADLGNRTPELLYRFSDLSSNECVPKRLAGRLIQDASPNVTSSHVIQSTRGDWVFISLEVDYATRMRIFTKNRRWYVSLVWLSDPVKACSKWGDSCRCRSDTTNDGCQSSVVTSAGSGLSADMASLEARVCVEHILVGLLLSSTFRPWQIGVRVPVWGDP